MHKDEFDAALVEGFRRSTAEAYTMLATAQARDADAQVDAVVRRRSCPLCCTAGNGELLHEKHGLEVVRCTGCRLVYSKVIFDAASDRAFYGRTPFQDSYLRLKRNDAYSALERRKCRYIVERAARHVGLGGGRLLEIGSGSGRLLEAAREAGWQALGIEPNPDFAREARAHGCDILEGWFPEALPAERGKFNVVALLDVIEHADDPVALLTAARERLAAGGVIVLQVPNYDSLLMRLEGDASPVLCHGHWNYFDAASLRACAARARLRPMEVETIITELDRISAYPETKVGAAVRTICGHPPPAQGLTPEWMHMHLMGLKLFGLFAVA